MASDHQAEQPFLGDPRYGKSRSNRRTERDAFELLCSDLRFQVPDNATKKAILATFGVEGDFTARTFDAVLTSEPCPPITTVNAHEHLDGMKLIELKTTRKPIKSAALNGFFFGATMREYDLAVALADHHRFCFVVLSADNDYGRPFFVLLTLEELERKTRTKRLQYQVNLRSDMEVGALQPLFGSS